MHTELPGIRSLIQRAFERIKPRYKLVLGVSIFPMLACVILFAIFLIPLTLGGAAENGSSTFLAFQMIAGILLLVMIPVFIFVSLWSAVAVRYAVCHPSKLTFLDVYRSTRKFIWPFFWLSILINFIVTLGFVALIIPAIMLSMYFWFADWILVTGHARGLNALVVAREYVRGVFWKVVWRTLVPFIALVMIGNGAVMIASVYGVEMNQPLLFPIVYGLFLIVGVLLAPVLYAYDYELFSVLKHRAGEVHVKAKQRLKYSVMAWAGLVVFSLLVIGYGLLIATIVSSELENGGTEIFLPDTE